MTNDTGPKNRIMQAVFVSRLAVYLLAITAPLYHPAVRVSYDHPGIILWFGIVPILFVLGYVRISNPRIGRLRMGLGFGVPLFAGIALRGFSAAALPTMFAGMLAFGLSLIVFHNRGIGRRLAVVEPFLPALLYHRLISFSRASESLAAEGILATRIIMVVLLIGFLAHGLILYLAFFHHNTPEFGRRVRKEVLLFVLMGVVVLGSIVTAIPPDFVENPIVRNLLGGERQADPELLDTPGEGLENGALDSRNEGTDAGGGGENELRGIPSDRWPQPGRESGEGAPQNQHAVMIVATDRSPTYLADRYYSILDPQSGFDRPRDKELNELSGLRTLETWRRAEAQHDRGRRRETQRVLSTLPERFLAYEPYSFEPTTLDRRYHPFSYSYRAVSDVSRTTPQARSRVSELSETQRQEFARYLDVPLDGYEREVFSEHLTQAIAGRDGYHDRIEGILRSFSTFQYQAGYSNNVSVRHMVNFLSQTHEGDCVEFSHSTAILARMAGIPSRVVTGFLAAEELQTPSHRRGLELLLEDLPMLQEHDPNSLYLVTTAHRHAWVQLYLPEYGWVDFETTSYSIPPVGLGDPNQRDVVIPLLRNIEREVPGPMLNPRVVLRVITALLLIGLFGLLLYRYILELSLVLRSRADDPAAVRAVMRLLMLYYSSDGYAPKRRSQTVREYAAEHPELQRFADLYDELRYRDRIDTEQRHILMNELRTEAALARAAARRPGPTAAVRRRVSLRGLSFQ